VKYKKYIRLLTVFLVSTQCAAQVSSLSQSPPKLILQKQSGFFRLNIDNIKMPLHIQKMGLLGVNYFADLTPVIYGGLGGYASISGTQGGLFVLGLAGGVHKEFMSHLWGDAGIFLGGGGGHSSLVGGGLMIRPYVGLAYDLNWVKIGAHYSYISFPSGVITSHQVGLDLDVPCNFYSIPNKDVDNFFLKMGEVILPDGNILNFQRNDFSLFLQAYRQKKGTLGTNQKIEDGTIGLVGSELDHYMSDHLFWYVKAAGAFRGVPNGYMDVLGGLGYRISTGVPITFVPQFGLGAGGGGTVETGGGFLVNPQLGVEWPLTRNFAARVTGGYMWSPKGNLRAVSGMGTLIYHLDIATAGEKMLSLPRAYYEPQFWRINLANQTYIHPQRGFSSANPVINLIAVQVDQLFTPNFFFSYQGAAAFTGDHSGGLATGMIGPGLQTKPFLNQHLQLFTNFLVGAAGGGGLDVAGGAVYEPVVGLHYALSKSIGVQASISQLIAYHGRLNAPTVSLGFTLHFGTLNSGR